MYNAFQKKALLKTGLGHTKSFAKNSKAYYHKCTIVQQLAVILLTQLRPYSFAPFPLENFAY